MFVGESGVSRIIQRTCDVTKQLQTEDSTRIRTAGAIDLETLQRYLNFHYSVTIDLFGADQSSNAATFYSAGLKGRYEEAKRADDHVLAQATYRITDIANGQLIEREVPMLNSLNEVLRDDFIKDSIAGIGRWNKVIEKAGLPFRLTVPHKAFNRKIGTFANARVSPTGDLVSEAEWRRREPMVPQRRGPRICGVIDGARRRAGQIRGLDRASGHGRQPPAVGFSVCAAQLRRGAWDERPVTRRRY